MKSFEDIINEWEDKEFGHYPCDCVPATPEQVKRLADNLRKEIEKDEINKNERIKKKCIYKSG